MRRPPEGFAAPAVAPARDNPRPQVPPARPNMGAGWTPPPDDSGVPRTGAAPMPLFADAVPPEVGQLTGPVGAVVGGVVLILYVWDKVNESRDKRKKADAAARVAEAEAEAEAEAAEMRPVDAYQKIVARLDKRLDTQDRKIGQLEHQHADCEKRFAEAGREMTRLTRKCDDQQRELDATKKTAAELADKVTRLVQLLRANGLNDTGEHTPLAPKD